MPLVPSASPQIQQFTETLTSMNPAEILLGGYSPSKHSARSSAHNHIANQSASSASSTPIHTTGDVSETDGQSNSHTSNTNLAHNEPAATNNNPIDPTTWMSEFDRSTARPSTSRRVSCPTPSQRDDYVERSQPRSAQSDKTKRVKRTRTKWEKRREESTISQQEAELEESSLLSYHTFDSEDEDTEIVQEDLSVDTLKAIVATIRNPMNSADEILKTYTRHQVIVALLMATNLAFALTNQQRLTIKMAVVLGRIPAAVANYREANRADAT